MIGSEGIKDKAIQHVLGSNAVKNYYSDLLKSQIESVKKAKLEGEFDSTMEWLDKNIKCDFSDTEVRKVFDHFGDKAWQDTINDFDEIKEIFTNAIKDKINFQDFNICREAEEILAKYGKDVESFEIKTLRVALKSLLATSSPKLRPEFSDYFRPIYIAERDALDSKIKQAVEKDVKTQLVDELEKMDDIRDWIAKRDLKNDFESYLESEATKFFRDALDAARDFIKKSEIDAEKAVEQSVEIL